MAQLTSIGTNKQGDFNVDEFINEMDNFNAGEGYTMEYGNFGGEQPSMPQSYQNQGFNMQMQGSRPNVTPNMPSGSQWNTQRSGTAGPMSVSPGLMTQPVNQGGQSQGNSYQNQIGFMSPEDAQSYAMKTQLPGLALGGIETIGGIAGLATQGDIPQYGEPERLQQAYNEYGRIADQGMPEVLQSAEQRLARSTQTGRQEAMDQAGPSTANAINAAMTSQNLSGMRDIAEMEADQRLRGLQNQTNVAQTLRSLEDQRTQAARKRYAQEEQAFGKATQTGLGNITNALNLATTGAMAASGNPMAIMGGLNQASQMMNQ